MKHKNYPLLIIAALLCIAPVCLAQTQFPDTPAGSQAKAWLEVFNAGDAEKHKEFLRKNAPTRLDGADREMGLRAMTGGFDIKKVEESTPNKMVALVQERASDQFVRFTIEVDATDQHQITRLTLQGTARPTEFAIPHLTEAELIAETDKSPGVLLASGYIAGGALAGIGIALATEFLSDTISGFTDWSKANNPFFEGASADWLGLIPFLILAVFLYLVGREIVLANRKNNFTEPPPPTNFE